VPVENVAVMQGDTDTVPYGNGTWGSRLGLGSVARQFIRASEKIMVKATRLAAHLLEADVAEIVL